MSPKEQETINHIERLLMAPCCYTQTIDVHMSDIARDMRREVTEMILSGQTAPQVFDHYKAIYGEVILAVPDGNTGTAAYAIPVITSSLATSGLVYLLYRFRKRAAAVRTATVGVPESTLKGQEQDELLERIRQETAW